MKRAIALLLLCVGVAVVVWSQSDINKQYPSMVPMPYVTGGSSQSPPPGTTIEIQAPPQPEWVPDPSAGHYDCPDGWTASKMVSVEPEKWSDSRPSVYVNHWPEEYQFLMPPTLDKKGHVLGTRPAPPICVKDKQ